MTPWLVLADDLTGAADCAIAFARRGAETVVTWGDGDAGAAPVLAVDADSRRLSASAAAERQCAVLAARRRPGQHLYKKIDSTLRGQPAAETAALLAALRRDGSPRLALVAPAFPATGRTTEGGRVLVGGAPLEQTPLWARDHTYPTGRLPDVLAAATLRSGVVPLDQVRRGAGPVRGIVTAALAENCDAIVCDAATEDDLRLIAEATLPLADRLLFVGTGGLAAALARLALPDAIPAAPVPPTRGSVLTVVGSVAEVSRAAAARLVETSRVHAVTVAESVLRGSADPGMAQALAARIEVAIDQGDVLVTTEYGAGSDLGHGGEVAQRLAALVAPAARKAGGLVATGGDTVCALLAQIGVTGIRLADEVEPGVPLGVTVGAVALPIATKAGGFGSDATLARCLDRLHQTSAEQKG